MTAETVAGHWTDKTDAEAAVLFDTLTTPEIRRRQDLCKAQQRLAYEQGNERAMLDLQRMEESLFQAMLRRT